MIPAPPLDLPATLWFVGVFILCAGLTRVEPSAAPAALILADPFALTRYIGHNTTLTTFKAALAGVLLGLVLRRSLAMPRDPETRLIAIALLVLAIATAATVAVAAVPSVALRETAKALEYALVFLVAWTAGQRDPARTARLLAAGCAVAIVLVALDAVRDFAHPQSGVWIDGQAFLRLAGHLEGPNQLAAWLAIVVPVVILLPFRAAAFPVALGMLATTLAISRTGLTLAFGTLVVLAAASAGRWRIVGLAALAVGLGLVILSVPQRSLVPLSHHTGAPAARFVSVAQNADEGGTGSRPILWSAAIRMVRAHPLLGVGAGNFELQLPHYGARANVRTHANSLYLEAFADGGIVLGFATLLVAMVPPALLLRGRRAGSRLQLGSSASRWRFTASSTTLRFSPKWGKVGGSWREPVRRS